MNNYTSNKKYKRPKQKTQATTNSDPPKQKNKESEKSNVEPLCPLAAKDSEWVDILQSPSSSDPVKSPTNVSDEEEVLQLVECEDGPQMKPLAIMFPGLLEKDPNTLQGMLNKAMSTTEVTKHLVDLGQKANFTFMKKADRLIPPDKKWLESLTENSNSFTSMASAVLSLSSNYEADTETAPTTEKTHINKRHMIHINNHINTEGTNSSSEDIFTTVRQIVTEMIQDVQGSQVPHSYKLQEP